MSCATCHIDNTGRKLRSETLSQGQSNGFPTYRLAWQTLGSIQRRFRECNSQIRAEPLPFGAEDYVALELYLAWRGQGLPIESPAVRK
jgi:sulfur-oxidizing protein SoxA